MNLVNDTKKRNLPWPHHIWVLLALVLMSACASVAPEAQPTTEETAEADVLAAAVHEQQEEEPEVPEFQLPHPDEYPVANFSDDELYELLVAEIAVFRSELDTALTHYIRVATHSRDPGVAARATSLAVYLQNTEQALAAASIWAAEEADNINAHRASADLLMRKGDLEAAIHHLEEIKRLGGMANFGNFALQAASLPRNARASLLTVVDRMLQNYPDDEQLMFSKAVLLEQEGDHEGALAIADRLLGGEININVIILKVNSLKALDRGSEAVAFLQNSLAELPDNRRLRLIYARFLFEIEDMEGSAEQYRIILASKPNDGDVLFALALIAMESKDDVAAARYLNEMVRWKLRAGEAHFYLGTIAERSNDIDAAIMQYSQVGNGYEFLPAQSRIAGILIDQGRVDMARDHLERLRDQNPARRQQLVMLEAQLLGERGLESEVFDLLEQHLANDPDNVDLLYFRAMTAVEQFDRLDILEADLRRIIEMDPTNADALNALGYTLADQTDRYVEALGLIESALEIKPDEAAFIDSLGWVLYRLERYEEAAMHLSRALRMFPNDEVAAHLGEVLWVMGKRGEASQVWEQALGQKPDSEILKRVIERFTSQ